MRNKNGTFHAISATKHNCKFLAKTPIVPNIIPEDRDYLFTFEVVSRIYHFCVNNYFEPEAILIKSDHFYYIHRVVLGRDLYSGTLTGHIGLDYRLANGFSLSNCLHRSIRTPIYVGSYILPIEDIVVGLTKSSTIDGIIVAVNDQKKILLDVNLHKGEAKVFKYD